MRNKGRRALAARPRLIPGRDVVSLRAEQMAFSRWDNEGGAMPRIARAVSSVARRRSGHADDSMPE